MRNISLVITTMFIIFLSGIMNQSYSNNFKVSSNEIKEFILANPEIILESLKRYEEKLKEVTEKTKQKLIIQEITSSILNGSSYIGGNVDGSITFIEFIDYKCGYCKKAHKQIKKLLKSNPEIRFMVKEFPILGEQSLLASKASIAILLDEGSLAYEKFTTNLLEFNGEISINSIKDLIQASGGNSLGIQKKMESKTVSEILNSNYALARKLNITGTPTFIIGTEIVRGYTDTQTLQNIINLEK